MSALKLVEFISFLYASILYASVLYASVLYASVLYASVLYVSFVISATSLHLILFQAFFLIHAEPGYFETG